MPVHHMLASFDPPEGEWQIGRCAMVVIQRVQGSRIWRACSASMPSSDPGIP